MGMDEIHVGDINTKFLVTIQDGATAEDISSATTKTIKFRKPDGTTMIKTGVFETDGIDGKIYYLSVADDLDTSGVWDIQGYVDLTSGKWTSSKDTFVVHENI